MFDPDPRVSLFGNPVSKSLVFQTREGLVEYQSEYESKLRYIVDLIANYTWIDIGKLIQVACSQMHKTPSGERGKAAWHALAWQEMFYSKRPEKCYMDEMRLMKIVCEDAAALYYYAIFVVQKPNQNVYARLKQTDDTIAMNYVRYCLSMGFSELTDRSLLNFSNWGSEAPDIELRLSRHSFVGH